MKPTSLLHRPCIGFEAANMGKPGAAEKLSGKVGIRTFNNPQEAACP